MGDGPLTAEMPAEGDQRRATLEWRIWPAKQRPVVGLLVGGVLLVSVWFIVDVTDSLIAGVAGTAFFIYALRKFFFPVRYRIDENGVYGWDILYKNAYSWAEIRRLKSEADGASFSKRAQPGLFDEYWQINIDWGGHRNEGERLIALYWPLAHSVAPSTAQPSREKVEGACGPG